MPTNNTPSFSAPGLYRIEVQGRLHEDWSSRLGAMRVSVCMPDAGVEVAVIQGPIKDQAELAGIMTTLHELHLPLLSVRYLGEVTGAE